MEKYGVALHEEAAEYIERTKSGNGQRSRRIRELVTLGKAAEELMVETQWFPPDPDDRERMVREAMERYIEEETK